MNPNNEKITLTKKGYENLEEELDRLKNEKRPKAVERLSNARAEGDLSENSDYTNAREELEFLDGRISELEEVLKKADVVETGSNGDVVALGTRVRVKIDGNEHFYHIVGEWEADPAEKKISHTSPLGKALIGKKVGQEVKVNAPAGKITYNILEIE